MSPQPAANPGSGPAEAILLSSVYSIRNRGRFAKRSGACKLQTFKDQRKRSPARHDENNPVRCT